MSEIKYRYQVSFWEDNSDLLAISCIRDFYELDKSEGKNYSSTVMWAIYFIYDYESRYFTIPYEERVKLIEKDFLDKEGFFKENEENLKEIIEVYRYLQKDSEYRYLDTWQETVESRRLFLERLKEHAEGLMSNSPEKSVKIWESIDKMLLNSKEILAQKDEILERINKQGKIKIKGDLKLSLLAKGVLQNNYNSDGKR
jgi:hypothetical protein